MNRIWIRCLIAVAFSVQFLIPLSASAASGVGRFILANGDVTMIRAGVMSRPEMNTGVQEGDVIRTGPNASVRMMLDDDTVITIDRNSRVMMKKFKLRGRTRSAKIYVESGKIVVDVKRFIGAGSTFDLESPTAVAGVIGTVIEFSVVTGIDGVSMTTVTCLSGSAVVTTAGGTVALAAGRTAVAVASDAPAMTMATTAAAAAGAAGGAAAATTIHAGTIMIGAAIAAAVVAAAVLVSGGGGGGGNTAVSAPVHITTSHH
ncbi:MAG: FecR domain-containing protein [Syntrophales bacterium]